MFIKKTGSAFGFTLIEIVIVVAIIILLTGASLFAYIGYLETSKDRLCVAKCLNAQTEYIAYLCLEDSSAESASGFEAFVQSKYGHSLFCTADSSARYTWDISTHTVMCPHHGVVKKVYKIVLTKSAVSSTTKEVFASFDDFIVSWIADGNNMPTVNPANGSMSWNNAIYSGTDKTNLFMQKFWVDYYKYVNIPGFDAQSQVFSDFKVFFKRDSAGKITSEVAGVYMQIADKRSICFSDGTVIDGVHYSTYVDNVTKQLKLPA